MNLEYEPSWRDRYDAAVALFAAELGRFGSGGATGRDSRFNAAVRFSFSLTHILPLSRSLLPCLSLSHTHILTHSHTLSFSHTLSISLSLVRLLDRPRLSHQRCGEIPFLSCSLSHTHSLSIFLSLSFSLLLAFVSPFLRIRTYMSHDASPPRYTGIS